MNLNNSLIKLTAFFNKLLKLLLPLVAVSLLLGIIFGPTTPFVGDVYKNVTDILNMLGEDALLVLISLIIMDLTFNHYISDIILDLMEMIITGIVLI